MKFVFQTHLFPTGKLPNDFIFPWRKPVQHQANGCETQHGPAGFGQTLVIHGEAAIILPPRKRALDHPPLGNRYERLVFLSKSLGNLHGSREFFLHPFAKPFGNIRAVGMNFLETAATDEFEDPKKGFLAAFQVVHVGGRDGDGHWQAERVDSRVTLAAFDLLAAIVAAHTTHLASLDALTVNDDG